MTGPACGILRGEKRGGLMLWDIRARMKPVLSVIDLIPDVHRTAALTILRRSVFEGRPTVLRLTSEDRDYAFHDAPVALTSPIGARVLKALYLGGHLKLKKPGIKPLPALDRYIATEADFRAEVARVLAAETARRARLDQIIADPACADPAELSPYLIDKVITAQLGHGVCGTLLIAGMACHRTQAAPDGAEGDRLRAENRLLCWWLDAAGNRQGDSA
ncbi:MAG: hypothetical protein JNJ84_05390 [Rhodobacteraceae bacterium]|nr:hypothetical protein [Paracoccaceae bacterium]